MRLFSSRPVWQPFRFILIALALMLLIPVLIAHADVPAYETPFTTSVVMMNHGNSTANGIELRYYPAHNPAIVATPTGTPTPPVSAFTLNLAPKASRSLTLDALYHEANRYLGSGILYAPKPLVTTLVQVPKYSNLAARPTSNGPTGSSTTSVHMPTVLRGYYGMMSVIAVQNTDTKPITATLHIYEEDGDALPGTYTRTHLPPGASTYFDLRTMTIDYGFIGSAKVTGTGTLFATATEYSFTGSYAYSYIGGTPAETIYLPSAVCDKDSVGTLDIGSFVAVRNAGTVNTTVTITYSSGHTDTAALKPNAKVSFSGCNPFSGATSFLGSAIVESSDAPIVALTKVLKDGQYQTAYTGVTIGSPTVALPYVRWTTAHWGTGLYRSRTYLAIQNTAATTLTGTITLRYFDYTGAEVATDTLPVNLPPYAKVNTDPGQVGDPDLAEFGYKPGQIYGGSIIIEGPTGSMLAVVARTASKVGILNSQNPEDILTAEDYTGVPIPFSFGGDEYTPS